MCLTWKLIGPSNALDISIFMTHCEETFLCGNPSQAPYTKFAKWTFATTSLGNLENCQDFRDNFVTHIAHKYNTMIFLLLFVVYFQNYKQYCWISYIWKKPFRTESHWQIFFYDWPSSLTNPHHVMWIYYLASQIEFLNLFLSDLLC